MLCTTCLPDTALLTRCYALHAGNHYIDLEIITIDILSNFNLSTKASKSTLPLHLKIYMLFIVFLLILKIMKHHLFVISTINLFVALYLILIN